MNEDIVINQPSCADAVDRGALSVADAMQRINTLIHDIKDTELLPLRHSLDRILAEDVYSTINVPGHTNSAVDGYAISSADLDNVTTKLLTVTGTAFAGQPFTKNVQTGQCVHVMTGAKMPPGTDTVVMQEHVLLGNNTIRFNPGYKAGQNVRKAGEDLKIGQIAITAGKKL